MNKLILIIIISLISIPSLIFAQNSVSNNEYTLLEPLPCVSGYSNTNDCAVGETISKINFSDYISYAYRLAIALSVFLAIVMIMWGGFEYMTSEIPSTKSDGKTRMTDAIIGLLLVLSSYLILETIDPRLVAVNTELTEVQVNTRDSQILRSKLNSNSNSYFNEISRIKVNEISNDIDKKNIEMQELKKEFDDQKISYEDFEKRAAVIKESIKTDNFMISQITAAEIARSQMDSTLKTLTSSKNSTSNSGDYSIVDENMKIIEKSYKENIDRLVKLNNIEGAEKLKKEFEFNKKEMENTKTVAVIIDDYLRCVNIEKSCSEESKKKRGETLIKTIEYYREQKSLIDKPNTKYDHPESMNTYYRHMVDTRLGYLESLVVK